MLQLHSALFPRSQTIQTAWQRSSHSPTCRAHVTAAKKILCQQGAAERGVRKAAAASTPAGARPLLQFLLTLSEREY